MDTTYGVRYNYGNPGSSIYRRNPHPTGIGQGFQETRKLDPHLQVLIQFEVSRQRGQPTHITNGPFRGPATAMGNPLSPLASLCLGVVRGWINVARRGKGGQIDDQGTAWTRLPAEQLRDQLEREFLVEVSTRSVQRALKELEEANQIRREQRWKHRYKRDYWYAIPSRQEELEAHRPRVIAGNYQSQRSRPRNRIEPTRASGQVLIPPTTNTHFSKQPASKTDLKSSGREVPRSTTSETARTRKETHMRGVLERCEEMARTNAGRGEATALEPETSGTSGSASRESNPGLGFGHQAKDQQNQDPSTGRAPAWHAGIQVNPTNTPSGGTRHGGQNPTGPMQAPNNGQPAGRDHQGRPLREVWVGGRPHLVVD